MLARPPSLIGATSEEVELALRIVHQSVSARFTDLRANGYIQYWHASHGIIAVRRTVQNEDAYVHIVTARGVEAIEQDKPIRYASKDTTENYHGGNPMSHRAFIHSTSRTAQIRRILRCIYEWTPLILR